MPKTDLSWLPESMKYLPVAPKQGLPVPVVNMYDEHDPGWDFTAVNGTTSFMLARQRRCGICALPIVSNVAFLGGPQSAETRSYTDPPMHVDCAMASVRLCPHIARQSMKRATDAHVMVDAVTPEQMVLEKPAAWVMFVTTNYDISLIDVGGGAATALYTPHDPVEQRQWTYNESGTLERVQ